MKAFLLLLATSVAPTAAELEETGRTRLYNMELAEARALFAELSRLAPESPAGPYFEANTLWMAEFSKRGGMSGSTFRSNQYWSARTGEAKDLELDREFKALVAESVERAEALLLKDPDDEEGLFFRGAAEGVLSAYLASVERSYFAAYQAGKRAKRYHERILQIDPEYADACLLPGIFEYTVATLPRSLKFLGFLVGVRGSKEKGVELVERAVAEGERTRWVARLSLSVMRMREKRYGASLSVLREVEDAFPRNPFLVMERGNIHMLRKDWGAARRAFEEVLEEDGASYAGLHLLPRSLVLLRLSESYLFAKNYDATARELERALSIPDVPDGIRAQVFLRRGMTSDATGGRVAAKWDYRRAVDLDVDEITTGLAKRYLKEPYR
jgi:tetratricopeptide (TPR) repeat protein